MSDAVKSGRHTDVSAYVQINGAVWVSDMWTRDPSVIGTISYVTLDGFGGRLYIGLGLFLADA